MKNSISCNDTYRALRTKFLVGAAPVGGRGILLGSLSGGTGLSGIKASRISADFLSGKREAEDDRRRAEDEGLEGEE